MADFTFVERKPMEGREHTLIADVTIGREGCDVVLADPEVSRRHAALRHTGDGPAVEDLGSSNGTFVNDVRIEGVRQLADGDRVRFGNTEWVLRASATANANANVGSPQVTAARAVPAEPVATASVPPAPPAPAPEAAPQAAPRRGDVPAPPEIVPSAIHRTLPETAKAAPPAFSAATPRQTKGSAATRVGYTAFCFALFLATLVGVAVYFIIN